MIEKIINEKAASVGHHDVDSTVNIKFHSNSIDISPMCRSFTQKTD